MKISFISMLGGSIILAFSFNFFHLFFTDSVDTPTAVQAIPASFTISSTGDASWSYDIVVPPGIQGVQPDLSIQYSSSTLNGLFGIGFQLSGLSSIQRTGATIAQDGFKGGVDYSSNDRFSFSGSRLMLESSGNYGDEGSTYYTEKQSWTKFDAIGRAGSGPQYFKTWLKKGQYVEFGGTSDSRVAAVGLSGTRQGSIREWLLNKYVDLSGNTLTITYTQTPPGADGNPLTACAGQGQAYPLRIDYTANQGVEPMRSVQFVYEARPDSTPVYLGGGRLSTRARMTKIQTWVKSSAQDSTLVRTVEIDYQDNAPLDVSRIEEISVCGGNSCYKSTSFSWTDGPNSLISTPIDRSLNITNAGLIGDFDGDGRSDLLSTENGGNIYLGQENGFQPMGSCGVTLSPNQAIFLADYNGDGSSDLLVGNASSGLLYYGNNGSFQTPYVIINQFIVGNGCYPSTCVWQGDFNGDGLSDMATGDGPSCSVFLGSKDQSIGLEAPITQNISMNTGFQTYAADFNGDGLTDLFSCNSYTGYLNLSNFSDSTGFKEGIPISGFYFNMSEQNIWVGDYNGDGMADLLSLSPSGAYNLYRSNGLGFEQGIPLTDINLQTPSLWPGDFNNDGMTDFYAAASGNGTIYLSNGFGFTNQEHITNIFSPQSTWLADFNGDGLTDLYDASQSNVFYGGNTLSGNQDYNQAGNYIQEIDNGIGSTLSIQYRPITNPAVYTPDQTTSENGVESLRMLRQTNPFPLAAVQNPSNSIVAIQDAQYVVNQWSENDGRGNTYALHYQYGSAKFDYAGYGFLGFRYMTTIDSAMTSINQQYYNQDFPLIGLLDSTYITSLDGELVRASSAKWNTSTTTTSGQSTLWNVSKAEDNQHQYYNGQIANQQQKQYWYDEYGNNQLLKKVGDVTSGQATWTTNTFSNDLATWRIGYQTSSKVSTDQAGQSLLTYKKTSHFDSNGKADSTQTWFSDDNSWLTRSYGYDAFGNRIYSINYEGDSTFTSYDSKYHTFPVTSTSPLNAQGQRLSTTSVYDPAYGKKIQYTDQNNNTTYIHFDALGKFASYQIPDSTGTPFTAARQVYLPNDFGFTTLKIATKNWAATAVDTISSYYDALSRNYKTRYRGWNNQWIVNEREYNANNQVKANSIPYFEGEDAYWNYNTYDSFGRIVRRSTPYGTGDSLVTEFDYRGSEIRVREAIDTPDSTHSSFTYSYFNGKPKIVSYTNGDQQTSTFEWDLLGRPISGTDPTGIITASSWNSLGLNEWYYSSSFDTIHYTYSPTEGKTQTINALGQTLTYSYDKLGRLLSLHDDVDTLQSYHYDLDHYQNSRGNLCEVYQDGGATLYTYNYDPFSNIVQANITMDGKTWSQSASFNPDMSPRNLLYPDSSRSNYSYTDYGTLKGIKVYDPTGASLQAFQLNDCNALEQFQNFTYGNRVLTQMEYQDNGYPKTLKATSASQETLLSRHYNWGHNRRISSISDSLNTFLSQDFSYTPTGRLSHITQANGQDSLAYDHSGNMIWNDSILFNYNDYQVENGISDGDTIYTAKYNSCGNLTERKVVNNGITNVYRYTYNSLLQIDSVFRNDSLTYTFFYDYNGNRNRKYNHIDTVNHYYVSSNFTAISSPKENSQSVNIGLEEHIFASFSDSINALVYYHWDQNGSTILSTDQQGNEEASPVYSPYGKADSVNSTNLPYQFNGKEYDSYSGLYYFSFRYYDPFTGRFTAPDNQLGGNMTTADVFNNYAFCLNNPISFSDPSGHSPKGTITEAVVVSTLLATEAVGDATGNEELIPLEEVIDQELIVDLTEDLTEEEEGEEEASRKRRYDDVFGDEDDDKEDYDDDNDEDFPDPAKKRKLNRPAAYAGFEEHVLQEATDDDGKIYCHSTGKELNLTEKDKRGKRTWQMGHVPGRESKYAMKAIEDGRIPRKLAQFEYNNPGNFKPEDAKANMSHRHEGKRSTYWFDHVPKKHLETAYWK